MVVFNCNACGEALKKNQVEKHTLRCRYCEALSCVDCGKDFWGNDYQTHTKCMTENEKYCGKNYVAKVNKGEVKQEQWIEKVQSAIDKSVSNPNLKGLLERLKDYPNIPRKKIKFVNFLKNSLRIYNDSLINQVWDTLMAASEEDNSKLNGREASKQRVNGSTADTCHVDGGKKQGEQEKSDKKEKKSTKEDIDNNEKGKKKKLSDKESTDVLQDVGDIEANTAGPKLSKRERKEERKKKANKKEKKDKNDNSDSKEEIRKTKKRKLTEDDETTEETEVADRNKKTKNKDSEPEDFDDNEADDKSDEEIPEPKKKKQKKVRFNWEATILEVLQSKGEMSLKKLQKKVLNEFTAVDAANYSEDNLRAKFNKKVNKIAQVKVFKDRVKLK
ncbi:unnamed protein product [Candidula unifasciata]|uniref:Cell growth-regulating nucleolar protein n=1 Tax=Candidula unifasciata TaxID=100452 RepID=A0A8S3YHN5_9EUPU|nr:unnamed protein product [Candidula unifasciata]